MLAITAGRWIQLTIFGLIALFFFVLYVVFPILIFFVAMIEKQNIRELAATSEDLSDNSRRTISDAIAEGFTLLGIFDDGDKGIARGKVALLLSADRVLLLRVAEGKVTRVYRLSTRLPGEIWLVTANIAGSQDLSGMQREEMLPGVPFSVVLHYHRQRVADLGQPPAPFPQEGLTRFLYEAQLRRFSRMRDLGLAKAVGGREDVWRYTARGAWALALAHLDTMKTSRAQNELAKAKAIEVESAMRAAHSAAPSHQPGGAYNS